MSKTYLDKSLPHFERAQALLDELTLEEKMAQVNCIFPLGDPYLNLEKVAENTPYGIGQVSTLEMRRIENLEDAANWQRKVQEIVVKNSPHNIPEIFIWKVFVEPLYKIQQVFRLVLQEEPAGILNWKKRLQ